MSDSPRRRAARYFTNSEASDRADSVVTDSYAPLPILRTLQRGINFPDAAPYTVHDPFCSTDLIHFGGQYPVSGVLGDFA